MRGRSRLSFTAFGVLILLLSGIGGYVGTAGLTSGSSQASTENARQALIDASQNVPFFAEQADQVRAASVEIPLPPDAGNTPEQQAEYFLRRYGAAFGIHDVNRDLALVDTRSSDSGRSIVEYEQRVDGLPVFGSELAVHIRADRAVVFAAANLSARDSIARRPQISADEAVRRLGGAFQLANPMAQVQDAPRLTIVDPSLANGEAGDPVLAWQFVMNGLDQHGPVVLLVDADQGDSFFGYPMVAGARARETYSGQGNATQSTELGDIVNDPAKHELWLTETGPVANTSYDAASVAGRAAATAHEAAGKVYDFYASRFHRDSYDGHGSPVRSYVDLNFDSPNAYWVPEYSAMFFSNEVVAPDVVAHEFTHGVVYSEIGSGRVVHQFQSGAIQESLADVFAAFFSHERGESDAGAWKIGESSLGGTMRDAADPGSISPAFSIPPNPPYPDHMTRYAQKPLFSSLHIDVLMGHDTTWPRSYDWGYTHINSTIPSHAAYLLVAGGHDPINGISVEGIGWRKAEQIYYRTITTYATGNMSFLDLRTALRQGCIDEVERPADPGLGIRLSDCGWLLRAFAAVGVGATDTDLDGWDDAVDTCPSVYNPGQSRDACRDGSQPTPAVIPPSPATATATPAATPAPATPISLPQPVVPGGVWVTPTADGTRLRDPKLHLEAHAYPTHAGDPAIAQVVFTVWWPELGSRSTPWHVLCSLSQPSAGDTYVCDADLSLRPVPSGVLSVSFDVYDKAGNKNLAPNGVHTIHYQPRGPEPTGIWIEPATRTEVRDASLHLAAYAFPSVPGDPGIDHVNFSVWWSTMGPESGPWEIACTAARPVSGDVFQCDADLAALDPEPDWRALSCDVRIDVYDRENNRVLGANGLRTLLWHAAAADAYGVRKYYPLQQFLPYESSDFSVGYYVDKLTLPVTIKIADEQRAKQEVNNWIRSHDVDPATHTIVWGTMAPAIVPITTPLPTTGAIPAPDVAAQCGRLAAGNPNSEILYQDEHLCIFRYTGGKGSYISVVVMTARDLDDAKAWTVPGAGRLRMLGIDTCVHVGYEVSPALQQQFGMDAPSLPNPRGSCG